MAARAWLRRRGWLVVASVVLLITALLALNTIVTDSETEAAGATVPGGRILSLPSGDVQVVDAGPRGTKPIVLIHCFTCAIDWWNGMTPLLARRHRVVAIDLLGHGGSEKPSDGYSMEDQAEVVAQALRALGIRDAVVVGHSLGGIVATALTETAPRLVNRVTIIDQAPINDGYGADLSFSTSLTFTPVIGEAIWRVAPDSAIADGLGIAFAPGFDVPQAFVDDFRRLTYTAYEDSPDAEDLYTHEMPLDARLRRSGVPVLAIFGAEEQIYDSGQALAAYAAIPGAHTKLLAGAGHSPNVERPSATAALVLRFAASQKDETSTGTGAKKGRSKERP